MKRIWQSVSLLVIGAMIWSPSQIYAQSEPLSPQNGTLKGFEGVVLSGGPIGSGEGGTFRIKDVNSGQEQTFLIDETDSQPDVRLELPGNPGNVDRADAPVPGDGVAVLARRFDGKWIAEEILVKPDQPTATPLTGVVVKSDLGEGTFTIIMSDGNYRTLQQEMDARAPDDGEVVIAFAETDVGADVRPESVQMGRIKGLALASEVRAILQEQVEETTSVDSDLVGTNSNAQKRHVGLLIHQLEKHVAIEVQQLNSALDNVMESEKGALVGPLVKTKAAQRKIRVKVEEARKEISAPELTMDGDVTAPGLAPMVNQTPVPMVNQTPVPMVNQTPVPMVNQTPVPAVNRTPVPTVNRTPVPMVNRTPVPTVNQTPVPTVNQTPVPTVNQTPVPTVNQTPVPTVSQTPVPAANQTPAPTANQTPVPTVNQTPAPTATPTPVPATTSTWVLPPAPTPTPAPTPSSGPDQTQLLELIMEAAQLMASQGIELGFALVLDDLNNDRLADGDYRLGYLGQALAGMDQAASLFNSGNADGAILEYEAAWEAARMAYEFEKAPFYFKPTAQPVDPVPAITTVRDQLESYQAKNPEVRGYFATAISKINEALKPQWWSGSTVLDQDVLRKLTDAIGNLEQVMGHLNAKGADVALAQQAIEALLPVEQYLAEAQVPPAMVKVRADVENRTLQPGDNRLDDLGTAFKELEGAAQNRSQAKYKAASDSYRKASEHASKVIN